MMISAKFQILNDQLIIIPESGGVYFPTAKEIYSLVFKESNQIANFEIDFSKLVLKFDRFPLELTILLTEQDGSVKLDVVVVVENTTHYVNDLFIRETDHVVIEQIWYPLIFGQLFELRFAFQQIGILTLGKISLKQYLLIQQLQDFQIINEVKDALTANLVSKKLPIINAGKKFQGKLFPYQQDGLNWLSYINDQNIGCILADEMGLGKTIQIIALIVEKHREKRPNLIVAPATLLENWKREIQKFSSGVNLLVHIGHSRSGTASNFIEFDIIITSYETLTRDKYMMKKVSWDIVVLDEAQAIKNPDAMRTIAVKMMPRRTAIAVTGTPFQNNYIDLWSLSDFVIPGLLGKKSNFEKEFSMELTDATRIEPLISPILLRRKVDDVAKDLPKKIIISQPLEMTKREADGYEKFRTSIYEQYKNNATLVALSALRMYCAHPALVDEGTINLTESSVKYRRLLEIVEEIFSQNEKVIIFSSWQKMINYLKFDLANRFGVYTNFIDGQVEVKNRQPIVDSFNNLKNPGALILNPIAAGVGLNITGANHVIHYNLEWNPAVEEQATARAYRRGQKKNVFIHRLYYINTVEEVINQRLEMKKEFASLAVIGHEGKNDQDYLLNALTISPTRSY